MPGWNLDDITLRAGSAGLAIDGHRLMLPAKLARLVRQLRDQDEPRWTLGRIALAAELPASVLADLTGISVSTAERWSKWAKRDWAAYVGQRTADDRRDRSGGHKLTNQTR